MATYPAGKTVDDGEIFVARVARCGKHRHKLTGTVEDGGICRVVHLSAGNLMHKTPRSAAASRGATNMSSASRTFYLVAEVD